MSTSVITTRTGRISDSGRTLPVVELQRHRLRVATRLSLCRDSVVCITATQSRPNKFQLRTGLLRCQDRREIHARMLAVEPLPRASGDAQSGRRPRHAKRCLPRRRLLHQRLGGGLVLMNHSYCFSSTNVETLPNRLLSATVVIFFPSGETVILSTLSTLPSRLKVASIERSLNFLSDTVSFAYVPFTGYSLPSSLASQFVPVPVDMLSPSPPPFQVLVSPAASSLTF